MSELAAKGDAENRIYETAEDYIYGEYGGEVETILGILKRYNVRFLGCTDIHERDTARNALALDIAGYYTGCLNPDGTPRVGRRASTAS